MSQLKFGDYISVEQKRFGVANEHYTHKVIRTLQSNSWTAVPVHVGEKSSLHESTEDVVECICCGVDESKVVRYRIEDVKFLRSDAHDKELEISAYQLSQKNIINAFGISGEGAQSKLVIEYVHGLVALAEERREFIVNGVEYDYIELPLFEEDRANATYQRCLLKDGYAAADITAELRAQGVDEFGSVFGKLCAELKSGSPAWKAAKGVAMRSVTFAANLRAGRKG